MARVAGKVLDEHKNPIEGVTVKASSPGRSGGTETKTNKKGEWAIAGVASGAWALDFLKDGYETRQISVSLSEVTRIPPIEIVLKKTAPTIDPNVEIRDSITKAAGLMNAKKFADARLIYEGLLSAYPEIAKQLQPLIARTYYGENQFDKAIEHLKTALELDPENVEVRLLLGNVLVEKGSADEGKQILASVQDAQIKDPTILVNVGIVMLNQNKPSEAIAYFDKAIMLFPAGADAYYYRGITKLQLSKNDEAKADLSKFLSLAPDAPEAATAKKILEQLK